MTDGLISPASTTVVIPTPRDFPGEHLSRLMTGAIIVSHNYSTEQVMASIQIIVGSVFGGALSSANAIKDKLESEGHEVRVLDNVTLEDITGSSCPIIICSSTTGQGEIPPNLLPFYLSLRELLPQQPGRPFGVIVFGDSSYGDTFCGAGELLEEVFLETGARKVGETLKVDALETFEPEAETVAWAQDWLAQISA